MNAKRKIDQAMLAMANDPQLAAEFDKVRATEFPNKTRREAAELALKALEAKRDSALAAERSKALRHLASTAASKFKSFVTMGRSDLPTRPDRRQPALPLAEWSLQHVIRQAEAGDAQATAELERRGYTISGKVLTKKA